MSYSEINLRIKRKWRLNERFFYCRKCSAAPRKTKILIDFLTSGMLNFQLFVRASCKTTPQPQITIFKFIYLCFLLSEIRLCREWKNKTHLMENPNEFFFFSMYVKQFFQHFHFQFFLFASSWKNFFFSWCLSQQNFNSWSLLNIPQDIEIFMEFSS